MVDQYVRNLNSDLNKVKAETASVMAAEQRAKRELADCRAEIDKLERYAMKALEAGSEADARTFFRKEAVLETKGSELETALQTASSNALQMKKCTISLFLISESLKRVGPRSKRNGQRRKHRKE